MVWVLNSCLFVRLVAEYFPDLRSHFNIFCEASLKKEQSKTMPTITFEGRTIECKSGENLRRVLLNAKLPLYNGIASAIHCRGMGTCGTCSLKIEGDVSEMTRIEKWRLGFPPHRIENGLRLACQCQVLGDLKLTKHDGMWGNGSPRTAKA
jgi:ferredoxin